MVQDTQAFVDRQAQATGVDDAIFDLISVLYHSLRSGAVYAKYIKDADQGNDQDLARFFRQAQVEERRRAEQAQQLLSQRLSTSLPPLSPKDIGVVYDL